MPSIRSRHSSVETSGVGPAVSTGKPGSLYWPGGSRSAKSSGVRRRPLNPRETNPFTSVSSRTSRYGREPPLRAADLGFALHHERGSALEEILASSEGMLELGLQV